MFEGDDEDEDDEKGDDEEGGDEEEPTPYVAVRTPVELGLLDNDQAQILKGVDVGEQVITVGQSHIRDGAKVREAKPKAEEPANETAKEEAEHGDGVEDHG